MSSRRRCRPHYHVLALDQRGHGESQWADTGYERDRFVEDLAAFVDELGLQRFVLAGLSMGGWHSLLYTPDHQERVERIIIVDIGPEPSARSVAERANRPVTPMLFAGLDDAVAWMMGTNPWATRERTRQDAQWTRCVRGKTGCGRGRRMLRCSISR